MLIIFMAAISHFVDAATMGCSPQPGGESVVVVQRHSYPFGGGDEMVAGRVRHAYRWAVFGTGLAVAQRGSSRPLSRPSRQIRTRPRSNGA
jgi:hypothetical protein